MFNGGYTVKHDVVIDAVIDAPSKSHQPVSLPFLKHTLEQKRIVPHKFQSSWFIHTSKYLTTPTCQISDHSHTHFLA